MKNIKTIVACRRFIERLYFYEIAIFFIVIGPYSERAYNVSALTCYNLRYAYYRILEIKAHSEYEP